MLEQKAGDYWLPIQSRRVNAEITYCLYTGKLLPPTFFKIQDHVFNEFGWKIEFERQAQ